MAAMCIIHVSFLAHDDVDASLAFSRDTLGFEVRKQVGYGGMRWITVGPAGPARHVHRPTAAGRRPRLHGREAPHHRRADAKGTSAGILLATADLDGTFARLQVRG
jgi:catechol 2,3-dioxygenase-like lactoylglutathione lyase family enzyme